VLGQGILRQFSPFPPLPLSNHPDSTAVSYMNIIHGNYDHYSLDCLILTAYITYQAVG
jgi:hypothetical protein